MGWKGVEWSGATKLGVARLRRFLKTNRQKRRCTIYGLCAAGL